LLQKNVGWQLIFVAGKIDVSDSNFKTYGNSEICVTRSLFEALYVFKKVALSP